MKKYFSIVLLIIFSSLLFSCAKEKSEDNSEQKLEAFKAWMQKYHPDVPEFYEGVYVEWLEYGAEENKLYDGYWIKINYTGKLLDQSVYVTRNKELAKKLGIFSTSNYYAPEYLPYYPSTLDPENYPSTANMTWAQAEVLRHMNEGDSVRIYTYADEGYRYGYSLLTGYAVTTASVTWSSSVITEMKLSEIIPDPFIHERNQLEDFVVNYMEMELDDYLEEGLYMKKTKELPDADMVSEDAFVSIYYTGRLLDGFLFDTNDKYAALENGTYDSSGEYGYFEFYPNQDADVIEGMLTAVLNMRYGEKATVAFLSKFGYGESGGGAAIPPYSPLWFDIHVLGPDDF
ncbi:MAG: FKBP-type peptidyl-prolyl cis-trans isomerase [Rikenellaceae bacterium]|nr:FKBP-type peptidyl-prolyl cis-trans isomerase [Rikenellaceae bacterium]